MANSLATPIRVSIVIRRDVQELSERSIVVSAHLRVDGHLLQHQPDEDPEHDTVFVPECAHVVVHGQQGPSTHSNHLAKLQGDRGGHA